MRKAIERHIIGDELDQADLDIVKVNIKKQGKNLIDILKCMHYDVQISEHIRSV